MFKEKEEIIVIAVLAIITSALISGYGVYSFCQNRKNNDLTANQAEEATLPAGQTTSSGSTDAPISEPETTTANSSYEISQEENDDIRTAAQTLGSFYTYLESKEYEKAVKMIDWEYNSNAILRDMYNINTENKTREQILAEICSQKNARSKIRILSIDNSASDPENFQAKVNYLEKDGQTFVNSTYVAGQFINETDFLIEIVKTNGQFLIRTLPGIFVFE